jgi:hypothetical protein
MSPSVSGRLPSMLLLVMVMAQSGCGAGWHRIDPLGPGSLPKRQQVQVWEGGQKVQLHAVKLDGDSLSGVPYVQPPDCETCRVSVPTTSVDSVRAGNPSAGFLKTTGLVLGGMFALALALCCPN